MLSEAHYKIGDRLYIDSSNKAYEKISGGQVRISKVIRSLNPSFNLYQFEGFPESHSYSEKWLMLKDQTLLRKKYANRTASITELKPCYCL